MSTGWEQEAHFFVQPRGVVSSVWVSWCRLGKFPLTLLPSPLLVEGKKNRHGSENPAVRGRHVPAPTREDRRDCLISAIPMDDPSLSAGFFLVVSIGLCHPSRMTRQMLRSWLEICREGRPRLLSPRALGMVGFVCTSERFGPRQGASGTT